MNFIKEANRLVQRGEYLDAGDLYRAAGDYEKALNMYIKVHAYTKSASLLEWQGRFKEAARHYAKAEQYTKAAELYKQAGDYYQSGVMYKSAGIPLFAAEMFEKIKAYSDAAAMYEEAKDYYRAGRLYLDRGMYGMAIKCFNRLLENAFYVDKCNQKGIPIIKEVHGWMGIAYEKLRKFRESAKSYYSADRLSDVVRVCRITGDLSSAATYLETAGYWDEAAKIYEEIGESIKSKQLRIHNLLATDRLYEAAELADESGEYLIAAEAYEQVGNYAKAGEMYRLIDNPEKAAEMFLLCEKYVEAAILLEKTGQTLRAAQAREKTGELDKAAELFAVSGKLVKAATLYLQIDKLDDAIRILQNAWSPDSSNISIRNLLGLAFIRRGNFELAYENYLKFLMEEKVGRENIDIFWELALGFEQRGEPERAVRVYEKILAFDLQYKDVKDRLNYLSCQLGMRKSKRSTTTIPHQFTPGRMIADRYVIKEKIGAGGMGVVYRALDQELGVEVALKVLKPKYANDLEMVQRFKQEVTLARQIHNDNVIRIFDFEKIHNVLYISMEFFPSRDLKALIRAKKQLTIDEIIRYMTQVCSGLWAAHRRGIIHRDIKPQNILINDDEIVKLVDFGIATVINRTALDTTEFVVGTPEYMSPEQARGEPVDIRSDIYSLGTILYESIVGIPPFINSDSFQVLVDQVEKDPVPPADRDPEIPGWLNDLVLKCLEKDPDKRYESVLVIERQLATCGIADLMLHANDEDEDDDI